MPYKMKLKETTNIRVRFNETDSLGIVWHGNYITYFEDGREDFGIKTGISYLDIKKSAAPLRKGDTFDARGGLAAPYLR